MVELNQYTMAADPQISGFEELGNSDRRSTRYRAGQNVDQAILLALANEAVARTIGSVNREEKLATQREFAYPQPKNDGVRLVLDLPTPEPWAAPTFHALQEWEGYVVSRADEHFLARLVDLTAGSTHEEEEADIPLAEVSLEDAAKMRSGSVFRWVIGYERSAAGTKRRVSEIVFRDVPEITEADLRDGEAWAHEAIRSLKL